MIPRTIDPRVECAGILGKLFGHKFQPRYDEHANPDFPETDNYDGDELRRMMYYEVYVQDVCVRCGTVVRRKEPHENQV